MARRTGCASNLHQIAIALIMYAADNKQQLPMQMRDYQPSTSTNPQNANLLPFVWWLGVDYGSPNPSSPFVNPPPSACLNYENLLQYVGNTGVNYSTRTIDGIWRCPNDDPTQYDQTFMSLEWTGNGRQPLGYSYFGRFDEWQAADPTGTYFATYYEDLTMRYPESGRLLVADTFMRWWYTTEWAFNHGNPRGFAYSTGPADPFGMEGENECFGDASVQWKSASRAELTEDFNYTTSTTCGRVGPVVNNDHSFYIR